MHPHVLKRHTIIMLLFCWSGATQERQPRSCMDTQPTSQALDIGLLVEGFGFMDFVLAATVGFGAIRMFDLKAHGIVCSLGRGSAE